MTIFRRLSFDNYCAALLEAYKVTAIFHLRWKIIQALQNAPKTVFKGTTQSHWVDFSIVDICFTASSLSLTLLEATFYMPVVTAPLLLAMLGFAALPVLFRSV
ncbi:MAG: hypothetical protein ROO73_04655 [Roseivirga sp.]